MSTITEEEVLQAMERYGGSFVKQLATLFRVADPENQLIIQKAWQTLWTKYAIIAAAEQSHQ